MFSKADVKLKLSEVDHVIELPEEYALQLADKLRNALIRLDHLRNLSKQGKLDASAYFPQGGGTGRTLKYPGSWLDSKDTGTNLKKNKPIQPASPKGAESYPTVRTSVDLMVRGGKIRMGKGYDCKKMKGKSGRFSSPLAGVS